MNEQLLAFIYLVISVVAVWVPGYLLASIFLLRQSAGPALLAGHGLLLGYLLMAVVLRSMNALGRPFSFFVAISLLLTISGLLWYLVKRISSRRIDHGRDPTRSVVVPNLLLLYLLLFLIVIKIVHVGTEAVIRPIFAWDAWDAWVPKTLQYFENSSLDAPSASIKATHGNFSNIIHLWQMLATGTTQSTLNGLPWVLAYIAHLLTMYGAVRKFSDSQLTAMTATWLLSSIPFLAIHSMLVGYADIWVSLSFFLGISCCYLLLSDQSPAVIGLAILYAVLCAFTKQAGFGVGAILLCCICWTLLVNRPLARVLGLLIVLSIAILLLVVVQSESTLELTVPAIGDVLLGNGSITLHGVVSINVGTYTPIGIPIIESLFLFANWHLLGFLTVAAIALTLVFSDLREAWTSPVPIAVFLGLAFTWTYHGFSAPNAAFGHQGLSRSMIYFASPILLWLFHIGVLLHKHHLKVADSSAE